IPALERLGLTTVRMTARWNLARVVLAEGRAEHALAMFMELRNETCELGMAHDVALLSVDAAEGLLMLNRRHEVAELCRSAMSYFAKAGLAYTSAAMTALAYLREAAETGKLTVAILHEVRAFIEVLPKQPQLQFAHSS